MFGEKWKGAEFLKHITFALLVSISVFKMFFVCLLLKKPKYRLGK